MQLDRSALGVDLEVIAVDLGALGRGPALGRLGELGLRVGASVRVVQRGAFGGHVLAIGSSRLAIDQACAARISVRVP